MAGGSEPGGSKHAAGRSRQIVHIIPYEQPRGAQRYARELAAFLQSPEESHQIVTLFRGATSTPVTDVGLDVRQGLMRRLGLDPRVVSRLRRVMKDLVPDLVVAHGGESAKYAAFAMVSSVPLIYLNIGSSHPRLGRGMSARLHRYYTSRADLIVTVSEALAGEAVQLHGLTAEKVMVIPNGRDVSLYRPDWASFPRDRPRLIWVGQLDRTKRPEWVIGIVADLRRDGFDLEAAIVGDGPRRDELVEPAHEAGVDLLGRRDDVPDLMAASDLLLFTGMPPEGMPGVLIEAGLCGVPVVTTRVPGADEVVVDGVTGRLIDVDDQAEFAAAVQSLLVSEEIRITMARNARERCLDMFSLEATARLWRSAFARVLTGVARP